jgi:hypothetical protein
MVDDDIKKLLTELNMSHLVEEFEKIPFKTQIQSTRQKNEMHKDIIFAEVEESEDAEKEERLLREQVQAVNKILVGKRKKLKWLAFSSCIVLAGAIGYLSTGTFNIGTHNTTTQTEESTAAPLKAVIAEQVVAQVTNEKPVAEMASPELTKVSVEPGKVATEPNHELKTAKIPKSDHSLEQTRESLTKLLQEREAALKLSAEEIKAFITSHAAKREPFFASKLSSLVAKCQQVDEEHSLKIQNELKAFEQAFKEKNSEELLKNYSELLQSLGL